MKKSAIILLVIISISIAMVITIYADSSTYSTFTEAKRKGTELQVSGVLNKEKELHDEPTKNANYFSFYMIDESGEEKQVIFNGAKPQDIERSEKLVLTGQMNGDTFHASKILMKCPSKYNTNEVEIIEAEVSTVSI